MIIHLKSWDGNRNLWVRLDSIIGLEKSPITSDGEQLWNIIGNGYSILVKEVPREIGRFF